MLLNIADGFVAIDHPAEDSRIALVRIAGRSDRKRLSILASAAARRQRRPSLPLRRLRPGMQLVSNHKRRREAMQRIRIRRHPHDLATTISPSDLANVFAQHDHTRQLGIPPNIRHDRIEETPSLFITRRRQENLRLRLIHQQSIQLVRGEHRSLAILATHDERHRAPRWRRARRVTRCQRLAHELDLPRLNHERLTSELVDTLN